MGLKHFLLLSLASIMIACAGDPKPIDKPDATTSLKPKIESEKAAIEGESQFAKEVDQPAESLTTDNKEEKVTEVSKAPVIEATASKAKVDDEVKKEVKTKKKRSKVATGKAKMNFYETVHNYGKIEQGDVVIHQFKFVNSGKKELSITDVRASCGCTQPTYPFLPILPGEEGVIGVKFDSKGKLGKMKPMITITSNADPAINKIFLEGFVDAPGKKESKAHSAADSMLIQ